MRVSGPGRNLVVAAAAGAFGLSGAAVLAGPVSAAGQVSTSEIESTVRQQFADQGAKLHRVSCRSARAEVGAPISCTALNSAETKLVLRGKVTSVSGDRVGFRVKAVYGIARGTVIGAGVKKLLEKQAGEKARRVTCPKTVRIPTKRAVTCALTTRDGDVYDVRVTVSAKSRISARVADRPR